MNEKLTGGWPDMLTMATQSDVIRSLEPCDRAMVSELHLDSEVEMKRSCRSIVGVEPARSDFHCPGTRVEETAAGEAEKFSTIFLAMYPNKMHLLPLIPSC